MQTNLYFLAQYFFMNCPKCEGGAYVSEEEVVSVLENLTPPKVILKITYICKSCSERFSRIFFEEIEGRKRTETKKKEWKPSPGMPTSEFAVGGELIPKTKEPTEKLRFLDDL